MTRRSFLKRTAATVLITVLAVNVFSEELLANTCGGSSTVNIYPVKVNGSVGGYSNIDGDAKQSGKSPSPYGTIEYVSLTITKILVTKGDGPDDGKTHYYGKQSASGNLKAARVVAEDSGAGDGSTIDVEQETVELPFSFTAENPGFTKEGKPLVITMNAAPKAQSGPLTIGLQIWAKLSDDSKSVTFFLKAIAFLREGGDEIVENSGNYIQQENPGVLAPAGQPAPWAAINPPLESSISMYELEVSLTEAEYRQMFPEA